MDRETVLQDFQKKASIKVTEFRNGITAYVMERAETLEELVRTAAERLGEQMEKQGKEPVSFLANYTIMQKSVVFVIVSGFCVKV